MIIQPNYNDPQEVFKEITFSNDSKGEKKDYNLHQIAAEGI